MFLDGKHWIYIREKTTTGLKQSWTWITQIWRIMELDYQLLLPVVHHGLYMSMYNAIMIIRFGNNHNEWKYAYNTNEYFFVLARWISRAIHCVCFQMITKNVIQDSIPKDCKIYPERLIVPAKDATKTKELSKTNKAHSDWYLKV